MYPEGEGHVFLSSSTLGKSNAYMHESFSTTFNTPKVEKERKIEPLGAFERAELDDETALAFAEYVCRSINTPKNYIDKGGAGSVYRLAEGVCIKVMTPRRLSPNAGLMDIGNHPLIEANILRSLAARSVSGVRVPYCYGFLEAKRAEDFDYLLMEELDAVNLQHMILGKVSAPASFDPMVFTDALTDYIQDIHHAGVAHGDLEARNVMVDRSTGLPRLIDFGRARLLGSLTLKDRDAAIADDDEKMERTIINPLFKD